MSHYFQSAALQEDFDKNGFVRVPLLTSEQCDKLMDQYRTIEKEHLQINIPFITTSHSNDYDLIKKADEMISATLSPALKEVMCNYNLLFSNFLIKMPGADSATPAHQDSTFVDETKYDSVSIWISLQDTDEQNGCMRFIRGSHKYMYTLRPTHFYPWAYANVKDRLEKLMESFPSKKGEAFIFTHNTIHGSFANSTNIPRVAIVMAAYPEGAELYDFFLPENETNRVQKYKMTKDAYLSIVKGKVASKGEYIGDVFFDFVQPDAAAFEKIVASGGSESSPQKGMANRILNFVKGVLK